MASAPRIPFSRIFLMFGVIPLLFIAGVQLFVLSEQTATYFAWTIASPLTAAFLGAGYWAALCAAYLGLRHAGRPSVETSIPGSFVATTLLGIATFLHLDKFHLASPLLITRFVTWVWILVYVVTPPIFLVLLIKQNAASKPVNPAGTAPAWLRIGFVLQALLCVVVGVLLFVLSGSLIPIWPWALTPLTAQAVGAWLVTFGVACAVVYRANDLRSSTGTISSLLAFCILQSVVVARYFYAIDWAKPLAWLYLLLLVAGILTGLSGLLVGATKPAEGRMA